jgi:hypothetical protein
MQISGRLISSYIMTCETYHRIYEHFTYFMMEISPITD